MGTKIKHYLKEFVLLVIFITIVTNIISLYKSRELIQKPLSINYQLPHANAPVLVHFWATWCPVCKLEVSNKSYFMLIIYIFF